MVVMIFSAFLTNTPILNPFPCEEKGATKTVASSLLAGEN